MRISEEIIEQLRDDIVSGVYKPRERLTEIEIAKKYNVSRTPVREAIKQLEAGGLLKVDPYRGAMVADIDVAEIRSSFEVFEILESAAARMAAENMSPALIFQLEQSLEKMERFLKEKQTQLCAQENENFHRFLYSSCQNPVLVSILDDLTRRAMDYRLLAFRSTTKLRMAIEAHQKMIEALRSGNSLLAQELCCESIRLYLSCSPQ